LFELAFVKCKGDRRAGQSCDCNCDRLSSRLSARLAVIW
jgi:hypothetical protein